MLSVLSVEDRVKDLSFALIGSPPELFSGENYVLIGSDLFINQSLSKST